MEPKKLKVEIYQAENGFFFQVFDQNNKIIANFVCDGDVQRYGHTSRDVLGKIIDLFKCEEPATYPTQEG